MSFWHEGFLQDHMVLGLTYSSRGRTEMLRVLHTIWKEQKITRKHTKGLGRCQCLAKAFPQLWGMQQLKKKGFWGQDILYFTARARFGSPCLGGKILIISCHFVFKRQSFKLDFCTGIPHPTGGLNKTCDTRIPLCQCQENTLNIMARIYS